MKDLISIIVPIYRVEEYLEKCIQSICDQTYRNLEIILVDDGSDDQCSHICDDYAQKDKRIKVIHKRNGGVDSARKAGMLIATGKYVGYVDGDDWIEPEMYEKLLDYIKKYNVDVVESGVIDSSENLEMRRVPFIKEGCYKEEEFIKNVETKLLFAGDFFEHGITPYLWSKLFKKKTVFKYQMATGITNMIYDDIMVALPCIAESKKIYISHECYYHYRVRKNSLKREYRRDEVENLFKCFSEFYEKFKGTILCSPGDKQIQYYAMYRLLYKEPSAFDDLGRNEFLIPYGNLNKTDKIVLYGAGAAGIHLENYIQNVKGSNIICWVDRNYIDLQELLNVRSPKEILNCEYDYIIVSIMRERAVNSAKKNLFKLGIPENKILWIKQEYIDEPIELLCRVKYNGEALIESRK